MHQSFHYAQAAARPRLKHNKNKLCKAIFSANECDIQNILAMNRY